MINVKYVYILDDLMCLKENYKIIVNIRKKVSEVVGSMSGFVMNSKLRHFSTL